jgi:hypothetical protein
MIDLERLARAVHLDVEQIGNGAFMVSGGSRAHVVSKDSMCDCEDARRRRGHCKHQLRVALATGDPEVLLALRRLIPLPSRQQREPSTPTSQQRQEA